jgi:predicted nuclease of restriction endonuclease-like (RecB) superfamily
MRVVPKRKKKTANSPAVADCYDDVLGEITELLQQARRVSAQSVNAIMTFTYWQVGRRIVESEQHGKGRAEYGKELLKQLSADLTSRFGRGFSQRNLQSMRRFYREWKIPQTVSAELPGRQPGPISQTVSAKLGEAQQLFPLPWSHYVRLLAVKKKVAREFYEAETIRGGWSIRQLERQITSQFYERTALSKNKAAMLTKGQKPKAEDFVTPEEEVKDPYVLEFLDLKDEYSECDLEEALIHKLEEFLLELGGDFTFVGRQRRLRIDDEWYRVDLLFFHRRLRCLVIIDLKLRKFTHADAGQMHMYLNYAAEHWTLPDENPPVGSSSARHGDRCSPNTLWKGFPIKCWPVSTGPHFLMKKPSL